MTNQDAKFLAQVTQWRNQPDDSEGYVKWLESEVVRYRAAIEALYKEPNRCLYDIDRELWESLGE